MTEKPKKFLIVKIGALGDLFFALPAVRALKEAHPHSEIEWLVDQDLASVLSVEPLISKIIPISAQKLYKSTIQDKIHAVLAARAALESRYDLIFLFHRSKAYLPMLWGKGPIFTMDRHRAQKWGPLTAVFSPPLSSHESIQIQRVVEAGLGHGLKADWLPPVLPRNAPEKAPLALHLGGGQNQGHDFQLKQWPHWQQLVQLLLEQSALHLVFVGGPSDKAFAENLFQSLAPDFQGRVKNQAGQLSLRGLIDQLKLCQGFVGVDSGPLHIADYLGLPSVGLFGPTSPVSWGLLRAGSQALFERYECQPCYKDDGHFPECTFAHRCLQNLSAQRVLSSVLEVLKSS